jgi:homoserine kinase
MKNWLKKTWNWLLGKTTVDEKVVEVIKEVKKDIEVIKVRTKKFTEDVKDVVTDTSKKNTSKSTAKKNTSKSTAKKNTPTSSGSGSASAGNLTPKPNTKKRYYKKPTVKK